MNISPNTGKALDLSGAFLFLALAAFALYVGSVAMLLGALVAVLAFVASFMAWRAAEAGDDISFLHWRFWSATLAFPAGLLIATGFVLWVLV